MRLRVLEAWRRIRASFWFLPALMVISAIALAFATLFIDRASTHTHEGPLPWLTVAGAAAARSLLSTIAGSMITVAGVTFSIVIVALTMASSQFSPRLLTDFMEDTGNQVVLGTFISVFMYCVVVLIHLPGDIGSRQLPQTALLVAMILAVAAVAVLIYFFHHISASIRAGEVIHRAGLTLARTLEATLPGEAASEADAWPPSGFSEAVARVRATRSGYLSTVDLDRLAAIAEASTLRVMIEPRAGDFVMEGQTLARVKPADALRDDCAQQIREACSLVNLRDDADDLPLAVERLAEVAVRSLSPGINDPYTAITAIHWLTSGLDAVLDRLPAPVLAHSRDNGAQVYMRHADGEALLEQVFGPLRTYGRQDARVLEVMAESLVRLRRRRRPRWDAALLIQIERLRATAHAALTLDDERARVDALCAHATQLLKGTGS